MRRNFLNRPLWIFLLPVFFLQCSESQKISQSIRISSGPINGVVIERNGKKLVVYGDPEDEIKNADMVLFTDFRRDLVWAGRNLVKKGSIAVAPAGEKPYFTEVDSIWNKYNITRYHDYYCQTTKIGIEPINVSRFVKGDDTIKWQDMIIRVLNTPGYTRESVSYIIESDGKKFAFTGDLIYGDGKIFDLYSFQDSYKNTGGYHGYASRLGQLVKSLQLIEEQKPDYIISARGPVISNPDSSIKKLILRIQAVYKNYLSISAYRWYSPQQIDVLSDHVLGPSANVTRMPLSSVLEKNPPSWYLHFSNSNIVMADDSSAFLIDCGSKDALVEISRLKQTGRLKNIDGIFITHYHDDHTNFINDVVKEYNCPVYITKELKDILENPGAYHMPCLTNDPIPNLTVMKEGEEMLWKDFSLTFLFFPGQTLYHDAVLFKKANGEAIFFAGDSFTPSGIDDYCLLNRNFLHPGTGYFYCLDILRKLPDNVLLSNQHVEPLFAFSNQQLDYMTAQLMDRHTLLNELTDWDDCNYGLDEQWMRVYPYGQKTVPGKTIEYEVKVFNHSNTQKTFKLNPNTQKGFIIEPANATIVVDPIKEGVQKFKVTVSKQITPGVFLMTVNIKSDNWDLREWGECLIEVLQ